MWRSLPALLLAAVALSCAKPREATVPFPPRDALTRAVHILESFEYNVLGQDRDAGVVRGVRPSEQRGPIMADVLAGGPPRPREVLWEVTVHVTPEEAGAQTRYRLESRATGHRGGGEADGVGPDGGRFRSERVPSAHLDEILAALADWRR